MMHSPNQPASVHSARLPLAVNGRFLSQEVTGVQRYGREITSRLSDHLEVIAPRSGNGPAGHLWEQTVLPLRAKGRMLWSPNASGPLMYRRQVVTFHDLFPLEHPEWYSAAYARWYAFSMRRLAAHAVHLIAVSEYTKSRIVALLGRSPQDITVVHNGCHVRGRAPQEEIEASAAHLQLPGRRYLLSLSSLGQRKNTKVLLRAWMAIQNQLPEDIWLVLAGPKADSKVYGEQEFPQELPRVFFTGYVPETHLAGLYSGAEMFIFPSLAEGFGLPLLEAMACGVPCLSSNTTSLPEVGGDAVHYVDPTRHDQLAGSILQLLQSPATEADRGRLIAQASRFSWDTSASRTLRVLEAACALHEPLAMQQAEEVSK